MTRREKSPHRAIVHRLPSQQGFVTQAGQGDVDAAYLALGQRGFLGHAADRILHREYIAAQGARKVLIVPKGTFRDIAFYGHNDIFYTHVPYFTNKG